MLTERRRQVEQFGHTPEADLEKPLRDLVRLAAGSSAMGGALDYAHFNRPEQCRRYLVITAALCLAAIERIDAEDARAQEEDPFAPPL